MLFDLQERELAWAACKFSHSLELLSLEGRGQSYDSANRVDVQQWLYLGYGPASGQRKEGFESQESKR